MGQRRRRIARWVATFSSNDTGITPAAYGRAELAAGVGRRRPPHTDQQALSHSGRAIWTEGHRALRPSFRSQRKQLGIAGPHGAAKPSGSGPVAQPQAWLLELDPQRP